MSSHCRSCRAEILWALTPLGKRMPVDAQPSETGNVHLDHAKSPPTARVLSTMDLDRLPADTPRYTSHFATCPDHEWHRRK